jgi:hypothetical protein
MGVEEMGAKNAHACERPEDTLSPSNVWWIATSREVATQWHWLADKAQVDRASGRFSVPPAECEARLYRRCP